MSNFVKVASNTGHRNSTFNDPSEESSCDTPDMTLRRGAILATIAAFLLSPIVAAPAQAASTVGLYYSTSSGTSISFMSTSGTDKSSRISPTGIAEEVVSHGGYVYWAAGTAIGRAKLDGTEVNNSFITGLTDASHLAVTDTYIFWNNNDKLGRANLDGTAKNIAFDDPNAQVMGVAANETTVYYVWNNTGSGHTTIYKLNVDGTNRTNIDPGANVFGDLTLDASHLYYSSCGRYELHLLGERKFHNQ